jgi:hypothetical protein
LRALSPSPYIYVHERPVNITSGDFDAITARVGGGGVPSGAKGEKWLDDKGGPCCDSFEKIIRQQLAMYIQRQISFGVRFEVTLEPAGGSDPNADRQAF